jgi:hypothetical protein
MITLFRSILSSKIVSVRSYAIVTSLPYTTDTCFRFNFITANFLVVLDTLIYQLLNAIGWPCRTPTINVILLFSLGLSIHS